MNLFNLKGVGKTSIISRFINNKFDSESMATTGANYMAKSINFEKHDKIVKFDVKISLRICLFYRYGILLVKKNSEL